MYNTWKLGDAQKDVVINVPPGSSKSTIVTQLFPVWLWVVDPTIRIISSSYSGDLSTAHAVKSRDCIGSDKFIQYFGNAFTIQVGKDNKTWYKNDKGGDRYATSTGGTITGMHADFIIVDDPINPKQATSTTELEASAAHMSKTLSTRKTNKKRSVTVLVMQRLHELDPTGVLLKKKPINHICLPGEITPKVVVAPEHARSMYVDGLLDPVRLDREALAILKLDLGSYGYANQIDQSPSPEGGGIIKTAWFKIIGFNEFIQLVGPAAARNFFLDTAYTEDQKNDPTALMANCFHDNKLFIINSEQVWKELPELLAHIPSFANQHGYGTRSRIMIEPKASGKSTVQSFKNSKLNVMELPPPEGDKVSRVNGVTPFLEAGKCYLVEGAWNEQFLSECSAFPKGAHDDQVDNLTNSINYYQGKGNFRPKISH